MDTPVTPATPTQSHNARWLLIVALLLVIGGAVYIFRDNIFNPQGLKGEVTGSFTQTSESTVRTDAEKTAFINDTTAILAENQASSDPTSSTERHKTFTKLLSRMAEEF